MDIIINPKNAIHCRIYCQDYGIFLELCEHFKFFSPKAIYDRRYKLKQWDGFIRLLNKATKEIYIGLIPNIIKFAKDNNYTVQNNVEFIKEIEFDTKSFIKDLKIHKNGSLISLHDYQENAVDLAIKKSRMCILSSTGSGKSLIIYTLSRYHIQNNRKVLIIVPRLDLVEQLVEHFSEYSNGLWDINNVHKIYSGQEKYTDHSITISTWQSLYNETEEFLDRFDVVIGDECHLYSDNKITGILNKMPSCNFRIGLTGTIEELVCNKLILQGVFGRIIRVSNTNDLIIGGQLSPLDIQCILLNYSEETKKYSKDLEHKEELDYLAHHKNRNNFIRNLALAQEGNTLILFKLVDKQGKALYKDILSNSKDRPIFFYHGAVLKDKRKEIIKEMKSSNNFITIASYGTFSTGNDIPNIDNIIFASPNKGKIINLQSIGRGLRKSEGKNKCRLFDIADDLCYEEYKNYSYRHLNDRIKIYKNEKFQYKITRIDIE